MKISHRATHFIPTMNETIFLYANVLKSADLINVFNWNELSG